jgi:hypothetical protein
MRAAKQLATAMLALTAATGVASAQGPVYDLPQGRLYAFHSGAGGGCPGLDWHIVVEAGNTLTGMLAWNNMQSMAKVTGSINPSTGKFQMTANEVGGQGRTATITGDVDRDSGWMTASVQGQGVQCQSIKVPWFTPPPNR